MKILVVEDNPAERDAIVFAIQLWIDTKKRNDLDLLHTIMSEEAFEAQWENIMQTDVIFFDIQLTQSEDTAGIALAQKLRLHGYTGYIVFQTSHSEFSFQGYDVQAFHFLVKPVSQVKLHEVLDSILLKIEAKRTFRFVEENRTKIIPTDTICYFASNKRKIEIYTLSGKLKMAYSYFGKMKDLEQQLTIYPFFVRAHRGHFVSVLQIQKIAAMDIYMSNGDILPIAKKYYDLVTDVFSRYAK